MHRCLRIREIIDLIVKCLSEDIVVDVTSKPTPGTFALNALARTCKTFWDPSSDALWHHQNSLSPLIMCMPEDLWTTENENVTMGYKALVFQRYIFPSDWDRFRYYAAKVQHLFVSERDSEDVLLALTSQNRHSAPLLPNLRHLCWRIRDDYNLNYLPAFLSAGLQELRCMVDSDLPAEPSQLYRFLDLLKHVTPSLKTLIVEDPMKGHVVPCVRMSSPGLQFDSLSTFKWCAPLPVDDVVTLANWPNLHTVDISINMGQESSMPTFPESSYPALRSLSITAYNLKPSSKVTLHIQSKVLRTLAIMTSSSPEPADFALCVDCLSRTSFTESLRSLRVCSTIDSLGVEAAPIPISSISPLSALKNLEELIVDVVNDFHGDDMMLAQTITAWPRLQVLHLGKAPKFGNFTLCGLAHIVRCCPHLKDLKIAIDAKADYGLSLVDECQYQNEEIKTLDLGLSAIGDTMAVAKVLWRLFPNLTKITALDEDWSGERWTTVQGYVQAMNWARNEERLRLRASGCSKGPNVGAGSRGMEGMMLG